MADISPAFRRFGKLLLNSLPDVFIAGGGCGIISAGEGFKDDEPPANIIAFDISSVLLLSIIVRAGVLYGKLFVNNVIVVGANVGFIAGVTVVVAISTRKLCKSLPNAALIEIMRIKVSNCCECGLESRKESVHA